ncbi:MULTISPECIES: hypothetical protein [Streptomyces]|uniref:Uncharacterized protein n=1 Tax=Streptomyces griseosporeus TaxID=1910 RepID=A0ABV3KSX1_STRGS|nr:hypothetical protein [Streptomyces actuosus]MBM4819733.1 hypothetical protein [Streptomyces actuosus]
MPTTPPPEGCARSTEAVEAEIRALLQATGGWLWGPTRDRYEQLRDEWVQAMHEGMTTAA